MKNVCKSDSQRKYMFCFPKIGYICVTGLIRGGSCPRRSGRGHEGQGWSSAVITPVQAATSVLRYLLAKIQKCVSFLKTFVLETQNRHRHCCPTSHFSSDICIQSCHIYCMHHIQVLIHVVLVCAPINR